MTPNAFVLKYLLSLTKTPSGSSDGTDWAEFELELDGEIEGLTAAGSVRGLLSFL